MEDIIKTDAKALKDITRARNEYNSLRDEVIKLRNKEIDLQIIYEDTIGMISEQIQIHQTLCNKNKKEYMDFINYLGFNYEIFLMCFFNYLCYNHVIFKLAVVTN